MSWVFFQQMSKMPAFLIGKTTLRIKTWRVTGDSHKNKINTNFTRCHRMGKMLTLFFQQMSKLSAFLRRKTTLPIKYRGFPSPGSPNMISVVCILKPLRLGGIVYTTALKDAIFKQPERTTRINSGVILSPAATLNIIPRTAGRKNFNAYLAQNSLFRSVSSL